MSALLSGFGLGFGGAARFGLINVLCLTTGLRNGFAPALGIGLGAVIVDPFYSLLAGLGAVVRARSTAGTGLAGVLWAKSRPGSVPGP